MVLRHSQGLASTRSPLTHAPLPSQRLQPRPPRPAPPGDTRPRPAAVTTALPADWLHRPAQSARGEFRRCQDGGQVNTAAGGGSGGAPALRGLRQRRRPCGGSAGTAWHHGQGQLPSPRPALSRVSLRVAASGAGPLRFPGLPPPRTGSSLRRPGGQGRWVCCPCGGTGGVCYSVAPKVKGAASKCIGA